MKLPIEPPPPTAPALSQVARDFGLPQAANAMVAFIFSVTGPLAIVLSVGTRGGLTRAELASWVFGVFFINGLISIAMSWRYQAPLGFGWSIPGTVLVGPALQHLSFAEVIGAFYATSALILLMGLTGWVRRLMSALPMPVVMGMVAGVFLRFGLDLVRALHGSVAIAGPMVLAFLLLSSNVAWGKRLPPVIGALLAGAVSIALLGKMDTAALGHLALASPVLQAPAWSPAALIELVLPLAITVLVVQNGQGAAILRSAGHAPPVNAIAVACGIGAALSAAVGAVSSCLTGPSNAIMTSSGERERQYTAALCFGVLAVSFGLLAPTFTGLMLAAPKEYVMALGGLAMLRVLQNAFVASFGTGRFTFGALVSLLVTVTDLGLFNIGAAFWGLVAGFVCSWLLERRDFTALTDAG